MVFRAKRDKFFFWIIGIAGLAIVSVAFIPFLFDQTITAIDIVILSLVPIIFIGLLVWVSLSIKYVLYDGYLYVRGGPFRSRIPYDEITKVAPTQDILTGYRILSAKNGIEIF